MKKTIAFIFLFQSVFLVFAQNVDKHIDLIQLKLNNENLKNILSEFVLNEKKCEYYTENLNFGISITDSDSGSHLIVDSFLDRNIGLGLNPYGYFCLKDHLFLVDGDKDMDLFSEQDVITRFKYLEYDLAIKKEDNSIQRINIFTDDTFSQMELLFLGGDFKVLESITSCD